MPYIDQEKYEEAKQERIRAGRARKATKIECRYGEQSCGTCKRLENCEDDGKFPMSSV